MGKEQPPKVQWMMRKVVAFVVLALVAIGMVVLVLVLINKDDKDKLVPPGQQIMLEGEYVCLPKEGDGPHTLECAFGLKTDDGTYYALNFDKITPTNFAELQLGDRFSVTGTFEEKESVYISEGVIYVDSYKEQ